MVKWPIEGLPFKLRIACKCPAVALLGDPRANFRAANETSENRPCGVSAMAPFAIATQLV